MANELNTSKTKAIYLSTKKHTNNPILKFQNCESDFVSSHKHIGVTNVYTKLCHNCALTSALFRCHVIDSWLCSCGRLDETNYYSFTCTKYAATKHFGLST